MTTMQKFKAYFGMVPPSEYEDDYLEEPGIPGRAPRPYRDDYYGENAYAYDERRFAPVEQPGYPGGGFEPTGYDGGYEVPADYAYAGARHPGEPVERMRAPHRLEPLQRAGHRTAGVVRSGPTSDQRELERVFADGPLQKITTLRPSDYGEARTIGERFRDGNPVIMDLVDMSNDDAKRLVDFAAGLAFALRGSFDKVATKVFLLSPADVDVSPEDRRKIAETGFYNHS
ncbi:cell division protein SepF [Gordonia rhizosphera]|uniref:Cell division protein SepF n=1 Tax=Gordonia rhizosphera NBRC 16068 TaxID=1108045 RepID=K6WV20_9ACTN|nr:cell division protein SepF [Gordonia rhizosphera]GAB90389.1 cell division protein SepF [Gordonia rhizosphera NBRC 16068]